MPHEDTGIIAQDFLFLTGYGQAGQASSHPAANEGTPQSIARHKDPFAARMNLPEAGGGSNQGSHHLITDHFPEGTAVEVFSRSAQEWVLGRVLKVVPPDSVQVEWTIHGCEYIKKLSKQSEDIRLRGHMQQPLVHASSAITTALAKAEKLKRSILADESRADDHFEVIMAELVFRRDMKNRREMRMKRQAHGTGATSLTDASKAASRELYATQASPAKSGFQHRTNTSGWGFTARTEAVRDLTPVPDTGPSDDVDQTQGRRKEPGEFYAAQAAQNGQFSLAE